FQSSVQTVADRFAGRNPPARFWATTKTNDWQVETRLSDGSMSFPGSRLRTPDKLRRGVIEQFQISPDGNLKNFATLDENRKRQFERFVDTLQRDGVQVIFFLTPYHPAHYELLVSSSKYRIVQDV